MTLNHTRYSDTICWEKVFNKYHRRIGGGGFAISRTDGTAYHAGVAHAMATKDWAGAVAVAKSAFDKETVGLSLLPQEQYVIEDNWDCTRLMIELYQKNYKEEDFQVIQPECEFSVPLEEKGHNCIWKHWMDPDTGQEFFNPPPASMIQARRVTSPHGRPDTSCTCYGPHSVVGKIDDILKWKNSIWIDDHKTTSQHPEAFWGQWDLNYQPRIYAYGAQKALGIRPRGFIINAIFKPSEAQVSAWNARRKNGSPQSVKDYLKYERQAFPLTDEDIERARRDFVAKAEEWEWRIITGNFPLAPPPAGPCQMYNKPCEFRPVCTTHASIETLSGYSEREEYDYVEKELYQISL